jgi:hypothetical protein
MNYGYDIVPNAVPPAPMDSCLNFVRLNCALQSNRLHLKGFEVIKYHIPSFVAACNDVQGSNTQFKSQANNPVRVVDAPSRCISRELLSLCFSSANEIDATIIGSVSQALRWDELAPDWTGYAEGTRLILQKVDALLNENGRARATVEQTTAKLNYDPNVQWSNFDVMDILSICLIGTPQSQRVKRSGLNHLFCIL